MDSLKGWEQRLEVWFGKYFLNSQRGPQHCIFLSSLIEKYQNKELDRFVSFLWVPVEKKNSFSFTQFEVTAILRLFTETSVINSIELVSSSARVTTCISWKFSHQPPCMAGLDLDNCTFCPKLKKGVRPYGHTRHIFIPGKTTVY